MTDLPKTWHFGLMAERWANFITDTPELEFLSRAIERFGQPVLDLACGAGRLLFPLMKAGVNVDGCDFSEDMLTQCRMKAEDEGLQPRLFCQAMHALELPRQYRLIYICGSFGLAGSRNNDLETLRRCASHLEINGALILNIQAEYTSPQAWKMWLPEYRKGLPEPWPEQGRNYVAEDGSEHRAYFRTLALDPLEQRYERQVRLEKWVSGSLEASEVRSLQGNMYLKSEVQFMLETAGFREILVNGNYSDERAGPGHEEIVFTAIK
jgi:SAM-dependent methyltransferase